jgi:hypothetical protein
MRVFNEKKIDDYNLFSTALFSKLVYSLKTCNFSSSYFILIKVNKTRTPIEQKHLSCCARKQKRRNYRAQTKIKLIIVRFILRGIIQ